MFERETIPCKTCGKSTPMLGIKLCDSCWEVERRLPLYLNNENAIKFVSEALNKVGGTPAESRWCRKLAEFRAQYSCKPDKVKPLVQYLAGCLEQEVSNPYADPKKWSLVAWYELLEQALDAYESTEHVKIKIERV